MTRLFRGGEMDWIIVGTAIVATQACALALASLVLRLVLNAAIPAVPRTLGTGGGLIYTPDSGKSN